MPGYDAEFFGLRVAKAWGLTPKEWRETDLDDRAMMIAFELFESTVESYRHQHAREYFETEPRDEPRPGAKSRSGAGSRSGINEFSQMKAQLGIK